MSCSSHSNSQLYSTNHPLNSRSRPFKKPKNPEKDRDFSIPHISKRMNTIEKYIHEYSSKPEDSAQICESNTAYREPSRGNFLSRDPTSHFQSVDVHDLTPEGGRPNHGINCVKYDSIANEKSEDRLERLSKLEKDYTLLKTKINPNSHKKTLTGGEMTARRTAREFIKEEQGQITEQDVQKQIKNTLVSDNGRKYFADLYLLKKGRQNIMNSLSNAGKFTLGGSQTVSVDQLIGKQSYEDKVRANQKNFVSNKIVVDREKKRHKMIKGRNLNWNVYYDILALSSNQKNKLKTICKFPSKFGIV